MKKRVRLYKAQMGGYNAAQQVQQQQQAPTEQQLYDYVLASLGDGKEVEQIHAELIQSGIPEEMSKKVIEDSVTYLEEQQADEEAAQTPNDEDSRERLEAEEMEMRRRQEDDEADRQYNQQLQEMYSDYNEHDYSDDDAIASDITMKYGGKVPSKRTFVKNVMKLTKKQLGGEETKDKNRADSTDTGQRQNILKSFIGNVQGTANDALMKEDAEMMYKQYFQDGGDTESGMMSFDPYHNLAHYSDTFEHAMPVDQTGMMKAQDGGANLSPRQQRQMMRQNNRMMRQTNRMIQNIPVGYGTGMFPQGINILNIAQPQMMAASNASPLSNYMGGVRMANIDVRRVGLFGRPKEYTINFASDVAMNPQLQKELMEQEARNTRQTIKDITDAGYTTTVTDSGIVGSSSSVPTEGEATDFFKKDDNKNNIPDYLEVTGSSSTTPEGEASSTTPVAGGTSSGVGGGGSRSGSSGKKNVPTNTESTTIKTKNPKLPSVGSSIINDIRTVNRLTPRIGDVYTLSSKPGYKYKVSGTGTILKYKGSKLIETIRDPKRIKYIVNSGDRILTSAEQKKNQEIFRQQQQQWMSKPQSIQTHDDLITSLVLGYGPAKNMVKGAYNAVANYLKPKPTTAVRGLLNPGQRMLNPGQNMLNPGQNMLNPGRPRLPLPREGVQLSLPFQMGGFSDSDSGLYKFVYGGDDISIPQVAGKLTDDAYFAYGGLTSYKDGANVTAGAEPKAGQTKAEWEKSSGYGSTGEGGDLVWNGKSWVKASDYKPAETKTEEKASSDKTTTTNTTVVPGYGGYGVPIYPPLFGGGRGLRRILGANALATNPFIQYAGSWTQQRGLPYDPTTGKVMDISSMGNAPLNRIDVKKTGMLSGRPKKYTMYFGPQSDPTAPMITMPEEGKSGKKGKASKQTEESDGKRKMAPKLENALLKIPGMSRVLYPYGDDDTSTPTTGEDVSTSFVAPEPVDFSTGEFPEIDERNSLMSFIPGEAIDFSTAEFPEPREAETVKNNIASDKENVNMPIRPSSEMSIPASLGDQELAGDYTSNEIPVLPLRPPGEVMSTDRQEALALQQYMQSPGAKESLMQFIPQEEENIKTVRSEKPPKPMTRRQEKKLMRSLPGASPAEVFGYDNTIVPQEEEFPNEQQVLPEELINREALIQSMGLNEDQFNQMQQEYDVLRPMFNKANQNFLNTLEELTPDYNESLRPLSVQYEKPKVERQKALQQQNKKSGTTTSKPSSSNTRSKTQSSNQQKSYDYLTLSNMEEKLRKEYDKYGVNNHVEIVKNARARITKNYGPKMLQHWNKMDPTQRLKWINSQPKNFRNDFILLSRLKKGGQLPKAQIGMGNVYTQNPDMVGLSDIDLLSTETAPIANVPSSMSTWTNPAGSNTPVRPNQDKDPTMLEIDPNQFNRQTAIKQKGFAADFKNKNMFNINPEQGLNLFNKFANMGLQGLENMEARKQEKENYKQLIGDNLYGSTNIMSRGTYNVNSGLLDESTMGSVGVVKYGGNIYQDGGYIIDEESAYEIMPLTDNWMNDSVLQNTYLNQNSMNASPEYLNSMISQGVADEEEDQEYAEGGETWMSEDQINRFLAEGGELEFI